jgi:uncharacterized cupredoxin-like copper-binding protein
MRKRVSTTIGVASCLGLMVWLLAGAAEPALGKSSPNVTVKATVINVTAGKPSELAFKLSKLSMLPVGKITFKVKDSGLAFHDFKICTKPVTTSVAKANTCVGKVTKILHPGQTATLTVTLKKGKYEFLCTVPGHAAAGMKGLVGVGISVKATATPVATTTTAPAATTTPATTTTAAPPPPSSSSGGNTQLGPDGCPVGTTIQQNNPGGGDQDGDEGGGAPDDGDGCL